MSGLEYTIGFICFCIAAISFIGHFESDDRAERVGWFLLFIFAGLCSWRLLVAASEHDTETESNPAAESRPTVEQPK